MTSHVIACDFNRAPLGAFTQANKQAAWVGANLTDWRPDGAYWQIMAGGPDGNFCRMKYPGGKFGLNDQAYFINLGAVADVVQVAYRFRWVSPVDMRAGPGKQAPAIWWGPNQSSKPNSLQQIVTWESAVTSAPKRRNAISQQQGGAQLTQPPYYTVPIVTDVWDNWVIWMLGGPSGYIGWELNGVVLPAKSGVGKTVLTDSVQVAMAHFAGGGAPVNAADMFADISGVSVTVGASAPTAVSYLATLQ